MSEKFRLDRKIGFQNTLYTKCINVIIDSIGPLIILRSILAHRWPFFKAGHGCPLMLFSGILNDTKSNNIYYNKLE